MQTDFILAMLIGASLLVGGLLTGYWRGMRRAVLLHQESDANLDALANIGQAILAAQLNLDALCEIVYQQSTRLVDTRNYQIGLFDGEDYIIKVWVRDAERQIPQTFEDVAMQGLIGWVRAQQQGLLIRDYQTEWEALPARPVYYDPKTTMRAAIFAPMIAGGDAIGIIAVQSPTAYTFEEEDLRRLTVLANQAAGSIRNAQLYQEARAQANNLNLIAQVSRRVTVIQPLPNLFRQIVKLVYELFGYYAVNIFMIDPTTQELVLEASSAEELGFRDIRLTPGVGIVGWVARYKQTVIVGDVTKDNRYLLSLALESTRSEMAVPLIFEKDVLGVLDIQSNQLDAFDKSNVFTLQALAGQLALAIRESQTYAAESRQSERLKALTEAARAVVSILDISDLLEKVVDLIDDHFGYDRVHLFLRSGNHIVFRSGSGAHSPRWIKERLSYQLGETGFIPWVAQHGEALMSGNVSEDDRYVVGSGLEDTVSEMTVPIQMGQNILGVFDIQSQERDAFKPEDMALVQALSDTVAIALRNASLFANETRRRILAETLSDVSTVLASSLDLESVLSGILVGLDRVVNYTAAMILLKQEDIPCYQVSAVHGIATDKGDWREPIPIDTNLQATVDRILIQLAGVNGEDENADATIPHDDMVLVPLSSNQQEIGHLAIKRLRSYPFTQEDKEIITTFANQATVAIRNAQLYMAQKEEAWISTALLQVAEATGQSTSLEEVLHTVAHITPLLTGVEWCALMLAENNIFRVVEMSGISQEVVTQFVGFSIHVNDWLPLQELISTGAPVVLDNSVVRPPDMPRPITVQQAVLLPLFTKGEVSGALLIAQSNEDEPLTGRKIQLVAGIANQAAMAIEGAQAYMAQQEEQWVTTVLLQVAEAVNGQYDLDDTLETIVRLMKLLVGLNWCIILLYELRETHFFGAKSSGLAPTVQQSVAEMVIPEPEAPFLKALSTSSMALVAGAGNEYPIPAKLAAVIPTPSILGLPLIAQGKLMGVMLIDNPELEGRSRQRQLDILTGVAYQTALAISNARFQEDAAAVQSMEREMEVARGIQMSLLPEKPPTILGWDLAAYYRPARLVGGDFYDFIPLTGGRYALVIADVADKGVPAAIFMATCRTLIRAVAVTSNTPAEALEQVNKLLMYDNRTDLFFTCWYAILDPVAGTLSYSSGGHNPPLLIRPDGKIIELRTRGIAIGVLETIKLNNTQITLEPGDTLLAYTDGLTEAPRADMTEFGEVELHLSAMKFHTRSAQDMVNKIITAVDRFTGGQPAFDDLTLFVLKYLRQPV